MVNWYYFILFVLINIIFLPHDRRFHLHLLSLADSYWGYRYWVTTCFWIKLVFGLFFKCTKFYVHRDKLNVNKNTWVIFGSLPYKFNWFGWCFSFNNCTLFGLFRLLNLIFSSLSLLLSNLLSYYIRGIYLKWPIDTLFRMWGQWWLSCR